MQTVVGLPGEPEAQRVTPTVCEKSRVSQVRKSGSSMRTA